MSARTDVTFVRAEKLGYGQEARVAALAQAKSRIATLAVPLPQAA